MEARIWSWWKYIRKHWVATIIILFVGVIVLIVLGYLLKWDWTGFNSGTNQITITNTSKGNYTASIPLPGKTFWDWLQLLAVLAIPVVVGLGAAWYTAQQGKVSASENTDNQRAVTLQTYIDKMAELLIKEHMGCEVSSTRGEELTATEKEVRKIARVRTLTTLEQLDGKRKRIVLQFLHESGLIEIDKRIVDLSGADLSKANLNGANLQGANLSGANLSGADLHRGNLNKADLSSADLSSAILGFADLSEACLDKAYLSDAVICFANLSEADLNRAIMDKTDLSLTNLQGANLSGANLYHANLYNAGLSEANLSGTILSKANLSGAMFITEEQLKTAKSLTGATMPDGSLHE